MFRCGDGLLTIQELEGPKREIGLHEDAKTRIESILYKRAPQHEVRALA